MEKSNTELPTLRVKPSRSTWSHSTTNFLWTKCIQTPLLLSSCLVRINSEEKTQRRANHVILQALAEATLPTTQRQKRPWQDRRKVWRHGQCDLRKLHLGNWQSATSSRSLQWCRDGDKGDPRNASSTCIQQQCIVVCNTFQDDRNSARKARKNLGSTVLWVWWEGISI